MPVCFFCKQQYEFPRGVTVIQKDTSVRYYCSGKCRKNTEMGRNAKKTHWVRKAEISGEAATQTVKKE
jgi:large subunit ribosomal protein L24e